MEEEKKGIGHKGLIAILAALVIIIISLVIFIIVNSVTNNNEQTIVLDDIAQSDLISEDIDKKLDDYEYTLDNAIDRYEQEIKSGTNEKRIETAIDYAKFVLFNKENLTEAIAVMEKIKPLIDNKQYEIRYYETLRDLCINANDNNCASDYSNSLSELLKDEEDNAGGEENDSE